MKRILITLLALVPCIAAAQVQPITLGWDINKMRPAKEFIDCSTGAVIQYGTNTLSYTTTGGAGVVGTHLKSNGTSSYISWPTYDSNLGAGSSWTFLVSGFTVGNSGATTYEFKDGYLNFNIDSTQPVYSRDSAANTANISDTTRPSHLISVCVQSRDYGNSNMRVLYGSRYQQIADSRAAGFYSTDDGHRHFSTGRQWNGSAWVYWVGYVRSFGMWPHALTQNELLYIKDHMNQ